MQRRTNYTLLVDQRNFQYHPRSQTIIDILEQCSCINRKYISHLFCVIIIALNVFLTLILLTNNESHVQIHNTPDYEQITHKKHSSFISHKPSENREIGLIHIPVNYDFNDSTKNVLNCKKRYSYIQLTDGNIDYLFGILAIHGSLIRTSSKYAHNVLLMPSVPILQIRLLHFLGIGTQFINSTAKDIIDHQLKECGNCWTVTFYKLLIFNMSEFDKVLYLDADVGIMHSKGIDELFDHPSPAAVSDRGGNHLELNGGVLLVQPNQTLFSKMLQYLPKVRNAKQIYDEYKKGKMDKLAYAQQTSIDNWNSEWRDYCGDQGFLNAFLTSDELGLNHSGPYFHSLHYRYGLLTSSFSNERQRYLLQWRPNILKCVHFTVFKPWHRDGKNRFRQITDNIARAYSLRKKRIIYQDEIMGRFFIRYWLDVQIALDKCGVYCKRRFPNLFIPDDVKRWLTFRPEPFLAGETKIEYVPDSKFKWRRKKKHFPKNNRPVMKK